VDLIYLRLRDSGTSTRSESGEADLKLRWMSRRSRLSSTLLQSRSVNRIEAKCLI
jgi:hypothetical protein